MSQPLYCDPFGYDASAGIHSYVSTDESSTTTRLEVYARRSFKTTSADISIFQEGSKTMDSFHASHHKITQDHPTLDNFAPFMVFFSSTVLLGLFFPWQHRPWKIRFADVTCTIFCMTLHRTNHPLLSLGSSVAYTAWTLLPGAVRSMNLPSHSKFMRDLKFIRREKQTGDDAETECKICWTDDASLAAIPCGHDYYCRDCLALMGPNFQTACPTCQRPLFRMHDRAIFVLTTGSVVCAAVNASLLLLTGMVEVQRGDYASAIFSLASLSGMGWYLWFVGMLVRSCGEHWWRGAPSAQGTASLTAACVAAGTGVVNLGSMVWRMNSLY